MSREFNRSEYVAAAKNAGVWHNNTVCAIVEDGIVKYRRPQVRLALYQHLDFEVPEKYKGVEPAELVFEEKTKDTKDSKGSKTTKTGKASKEAPKPDRISTLESRMDSLESKLDKILAKLG